MTHSIEAEGIGKEYRLGLRGMRSTTLYEKLASWRAPKRVGGEHFWALRDVSFGIECGEAVGIVGRNGAGKSTLLKILSRITDPTEGRILLHGRVSSLLEVGTGFHPELTGRENIRLNGAILGMTRAEVERRLDEIVAFAEVGPFLETPVKRYSSGMYVRLAFAVAAHLDPDILLVDEVLAVGDAAFQRRCLGRMQEVASEGRTVILVSHNMAAISRLCDRAICVDGGRIVADGPVQKVVEGYLKDSAEVSGEWCVAEEDSTQGHRYLRAARMVDREGRTAGVADFDRGFGIEIDFVAPPRDEEYVVAWRLIDAMGMDVFSSWDCDAGEPRQTTGGRLHTARCEVPPKLVRPGSYTIVPMVETIKGGTRESLERGSFGIQVSEIGFGRFESRWGVVSPFLEWRTQPAEGTLVE